MADFNDMHTAQTFLLRAEIHSVFTFELNSKGKFEYLVFIIFQMHANTFHISPVVTVYLQRPFSCHLHFYHWMHRQWCSEVGR